MTRSPWGGNVAAAWDFIATVDEPSVNNRRVPLGVSAGAVRDDLENVIWKGVRHMRGSEDYLLHDFRIRSACRAFQCAPDDREAVCRILVIRFRLEKQRIFGEDGEPVRELEVMMSVIHLALLVMADARDVAEHLPGRDRPRLLRERRTISLDRCVEVEFAILD